MAEEVEDPKPHDAEGASLNPADSSGDAAAQPPPAGGGGGGGGGIGGFSLSIWPPTQRTRDAVIRRLVENLTSSTVLSKRYGVVPADEAEESARALESEAFAAASAAAAEGGAKGADSVEEGIEVLHVYSKEISRRLLEFAKSRASAASPAASLPSAASDAPTESAASAAEVASPPAVGEEASTDASEPSTA